jgi:NDP-sugar pyrophosphorylase family protein
VFTVAILGGGFATRLYPLTNSRPKSLIEVAGKPFLGWQLELLRNHGVNRVVLCLGHYSVLIRDYIATQDFELEVVISEDGVNPLGTGGAILKAIPVLGEQFMVLNGDSFLEVDYNKVCSAFIESKKKGLMTIYKNQNELEKSNVEYSDGKVVKYIKGGDPDTLEYIDFGLSVFSASAFSQFEHGIAFDLSSVYQKLISIGELASFITPNRFYEIGSHEGLRDTTEYIERLEKNVH